MMKINKVNILEKESTFSWEELFFSYTNSQGIVEGGNEVFRRVSKYEWIEIINKPHNIIRHSDMPKGIFYLFWKILAQGSSIGAFVKNRAKDGSYYWVFALASPIESGYISVRQKPGGELFLKIPELYKKWRQHEESLHLKPKESGEYILKELSDLGFSSYIDFSSQAFSQCIETRYDKLGWLNMNEDFIELRKLQSHAQSIFEQAIKAIMSYKAIKHIPLNMHICSDNLGNLPTVSVVANKFQELTSEIQASIKRFESATSIIRESIKLALFSVCASKLNHEMASSFQDQSKGDSEKNYEFEISQLIEVFSKSKVTSLEQLQNVINLSNEILSSCENLRNVLLGLDLIRVSGRIEIAKMNIQNDNLTNFMNELMVFKSSILNSITQISNCAERIQSTTLTLSEVG